jgi:hypothetical protein
VQGGRPARFSVKQTIKPAGILIGFRFEGGDAFDEELMGYH